MTKARERLAPGLDPIGRWRPSTPRRVARAAALVVAVAAACAFLDLRGFGPFESYADALRISIYGRVHWEAAEAARQRIALVAYGDETFADLPPPPIPRSYHAELIRRLTLAGARLIVFDIWFRRETPLDAALARAARDCGRVVWSCPMEETGTGQRQLALPVRRLREASPHWGHTFVLQDPDGQVHRRVPVVLSCGAIQVPALSVQAAAMAAGLDGASLERTSKGWRVGPLEIPADGDDAFPILYGSAPGETWAPIPYEQVYRGAPGDPFLRDLLKDKIVIVGDARSLTADRQPPPVGTMCGVEVQAHAIATILGGLFITQAPPPANLAAICLMALAACPLVAVCRLRWALGSTAAAVVGYFVVNVWLFTDRGLSLHLVAPLVAAGLVGAGMVRECGVAEERERRRMRALLERYVSPQVAAHIAANPDAYALGGREVTATVLFSDIRGFTTLAERLPAAQVTAQLNEYLEAMTEVVFRHDGALDKYIGDAVMALFGAPVPHPDHARRAVATALDMQAAVARLHADWRARGLPLLQTCIGINTGEMVVGNVGSAWHAEFTVIGDAVNVAQRVESLNRELGTSILITEATYGAVRDLVRVRGPLLQVLRGRHEQVVVYEVLAWGSAPAERATDDE